MGRSWEHLKMFELAQSGWSLKSSVPPDSTHFDRINTYIPAILRWWKYIYPAVCREGYQGVDPSAFPFSFQRSAHFLNTGVPDFSPTAKLCYGVFSPDELRCDPVQLQHQVPDKVPEGSGADTLWGSGS